MFAVRRGIGIAAACLVAAFGSVVIASACLVDLPLEVSCGDGYVDLEAGEECEPSLPDTFKDACDGELGAGGTAVCDPLTCRIESDCQPCGNGVLDEGEECDPNATGTADYVASRPCAGANLGTPEEIPPLVSPYSDKPYASGTTSRCTDRCEWSRVGCSYCGDGIVDVDFVVDLDGAVPARPEVCDGDEIPDEALSELPSWLRQECAAQDELRPNVQCNSSCSGLVAGFQPTCCVRGGEPCPAPGSDLQCCYAYAHPDEPACQALHFVVDGVTRVRNLCRLVGQFPNDG
jgi:hypothetical protein